MFSGLSKSKLQQGQQIFRVQRQLEAPRRACKTATTIGLLCIMQFHYERGKLTEKSLYIIEALLLCYVTNRK